MKRIKTSTLGAALGAGILASVALLPQARGELVYETETQKGATAAAADRELTRQTLGAAVRVEGAPAEQAVVVPQTQIIQSAPIVQSAPVLQSAPAEETPTLTKSELMRRERTRVELKNEDILQERLEELRLRDEKRRTDELIGGSMVATVAPAPTPVVIKEEPVGALAQQTMTVAASTEQGPSLVAGSSVLSVEEPTDIAMVFVRPRGGVANMTSQSYYEIRPHFSVGLDLGVAVSDNLSFEAGYTFSEYGVALNNYYQTSIMNSGYLGNFETVAMKQNVGDLGLKLHFLGQDARLRPFIGGGGSYAKSFINYDQSILSRLDAQSRLYYGRDYDLTQFLGFLSTGFDIRVNKSISVGAMFKYYTVLSARENSSINSNALYGGTPMYGYYSPYSYSAYDTDKQLVGGSVAKASFYTIAAGATFVF